MSAFPVRGASNLEELGQLLAQPDVRAVRYRYCVSLILATFEFTSPVMLVPNEDTRVSVGIMYILVSCLLGWWSLPWGPVLTLHRAYECFQGGLDVTDELKQWHAAQIQQKLEAR